MIPIYTRTKRHLKGQTDRRTEKYMDKETGQWRTSQLLGMERSVVSQTDREQQTKWWRGRKPDTGKERQKGKEG